MCEGCPHPPHHGRCHVIVGNATCPCKTRHQPDAARVARHQGDAFETIFDAMREMPK